VDYDQYGPAHWNVRGELSFEAAEILVLPQVAHVCRTLDREIRELNGNRIR
jgi:hypothetical protein